MCIKDLSRSFTDEYLTILFSEAGGSSLTFSNFNPGVHPTLLPPAQQGEWASYGGGGGYNGQEVSVVPSPQPYSSGGQQPSSAYAFHPHPQNLYATYSGMFVPGGGSDSGGGGCNSTFYTTTGSPNSSSQMGSHEGMSYMVEDKILNDPNGDGQGDSPKDSSI